MNKCCSQSNNARYHQLETSLSTDMLAEGTRHRKGACNLIEMAIHAHDTVQHALKSDVAYPFETKTLQVHTVP